jgi:RNA polymerase sigma factor (sigma-70 family)
MSEPRKAFVERLFARHGGALQAFFHRRIRTKSDAPDLAQEVYLRLLRVSDPETIRNPEAYLYTVAGNLLKENSAADRRQVSAAELEEADAAQLHSEWPGFEGPLDTQQRIEWLQSALRQLPAKCCAALVYQYRYGLSYQEIAVRLEVSPHMVKKYLTRALGQCRRRMACRG